MSSDFVPEPYSSGQPDRIQRWEDDELVGFSVITRVRLREALGEDVMEGVSPAAAFTGEIEPARCRPMGTRLFHSDMGLLAECWELLDPIPSTGARPGDLLFHCAGAVLGRRRNRGDPWPTEWAIMYGDESTYVAFLTREHLRTLYFPATEEGEKEVSDA